MALTSCWLVWRWTLTRTDKTTLVAHAVAKPSAVCPRTRRVIRVGAVTNEAHAWCAKNSLIRDVIRWVTNAHPGLYYQQTPLYSRTICSSWHKNAKFTVCEAVPYLSRCAGKVWWGSRRSNTLTWLELSIHSVCKQSSHTCILRSCSWLRA